MQKQHLAPFEKKKKNAETTPTPFEKEKMHKQHLAASKNIVD
jgi:hypothetical protein